MNRTLVAARHLLTIGCLSFAALACGGGGGYSGGGTPTSPQPQTNNIVVEVRDFEFFPKSITVRPGDSVTWRLTGSAGIGHSVIASGGEFSSGFVFNAAGAEFTHMFTAGDNGKTVKYYCVTHQACCQMQGSIRVGDNARPPPSGY